MSDHSLPVEPPRLAKALRAERLGTLPVPAAARAPGLEVAGRESAWSLAAFARPSFARVLIAANVIAVLAFIAGVFWVMDARVGLVEERIRGLFTQGRVIAGALGEGAILTPDADRFDTDRALSLMRRIAEATNVRARLYDRNGRLVIDSNAFLRRGSVAIYELPPPGRAPLFGAEFFEAIYDAVVTRLPARDLPPYREQGFSGIGFSEVRQALGGGEASAVRANDRGELVVSVAVPVSRVQFVQGALMLTIEGGDIERIVRAERVGVLQVAALALAAMIGASILVAAWFGRPLARLASAADAVRRGAGLRGAIPDYEGRGDEIGELSRALRAMTEALAARIDAIERFAADVAHEIKNPLTSLRSAVETLGRVQDPAQAKRLFEVLQEDIRRIDRLVTDIADASRLDAELSRERFQPVRLAGLLAAIASVQNDRARGRVKVAFAADVGAAGAESVVVDGLPDRLGQVFSNVIDNAMSFSPDGATVALRLTVAGREATVTIDDEGPGIPADSLEKIFDRFYTSRPAEHGFGKNSGLGLAIARQIVALHGGTITASNRVPGPGARFTVRFPARLG